jgi:sporulation protein YlmC with PRC-barrel domain
MIRKLLATSAIAALLASGVPAYAQETTQPSPATPGATDTTDTSSQPASSNPADTSGTTIFNRDSSMDAGTDTNGYITAEGSEILASSLLGQPVYSGPGADAETIGDVNDVLMSPDGTAEAIIIGVGGFLGIGEKDVAVDFSRVTWGEQDGARRLVVATSPDELNNAPAFDRSIIDTFEREPAMDDTAATTDTNASTTAGTATTTTTGDTAESDVAVPDGTAAPADANATPATDADTAAANTMAADGTAVDPTTLSADDLIGTAVYDGNDDRIGEVSDVILGADSNTVEAYIVDVGGFLGIGEKPVALAVDSLDIQRAEDGSLSVRSQLTEDQLNNGPSYSQDAYAADPNSVLVR